MRSWPLLTVKAHPNWLPLEPELFFVQLQVVVWVNAARLKRIDTASQHILDVLRSIEIWVPHDSVFLQRTKPDCRPIKDFTLVHFHVLGRLDGMILLVNWRASTVP